MGRGTDMAWISILMHPFIHPFIHSTECLSYAQLGSGRCWSHWLRTWPPALPLELTVQGKRQVWPKVVGL